MPPTPPDPPPPDWDSSGGASTDFNNAHSWANSYGYDSTNMAFKDANGTANYLYQSTSNVTSGHVAWALCTAASSNNCPQAKIPQATFDVVKGGTLDTSTMKISYSGHTYLLSLERDANGTQIAYAKQLS